MADKLLIDTDVLIDYLRDFAPAADFLEKQEPGMNLSVITVAELYQGVREGDERRALDIMLGAFEIMPLTANIAIQGGLFCRKYKKSHGIGLADALIAATVEAHGFCLATLNTRHYPMLDNIIVPYKKNPA